MGGGGQGAPNKIHTIHLPITMVIFSVRILAFSMRPMPERLQALPRGTVPFLTCSANEERICVGDKT